MIRLFLGFLIVAGIFLGTAFPGNAGEIELEDGSVVSGEITSLRDGIYTIRTESLGTFMVDESQVRTIRVRTDRKVPENTLPPVPAGNSVSVLPDKGTPAPAGNSVSALPDMGAMQTRIMNNEQMMQSIMALKNDPEIMKVLQDPAITQALVSGDVNTLLADPRFMKLMNHPGLKKIQKDLAR